MIIIVRINKDEKEKILARFPDAYMYRTCIQRSKRHCYYCIETKGILKLLDKIRNGDAVC